MLVHLIMKTYPNLISHELDRVDFSALTDNENEVRSRMFEKFMLFTEHFPCNVEN